MTSYISYNSFEKKDKCNECDENEIKECCNKCGEGVCLTEYCCQIFPHYNDSLYIICRGCSIDIEKKLHLQLNLGELRLLKQKINKRHYNKIKKLEKMEKCKK